MPFPVQTHRGGGGQPRVAEFYRRLLDLTVREDPTPLLESALDALVEVTGAREGYIELRQGKWSASYGVSPDREDEIRSAISESIVAEAIESGETIVTPSAVLDPRFEARESVRELGIEAVVCAPLGDGEPVGVVYLQGSGLVTAETAVGDHVRYFARVVGPLAAGLLDDERREEARQGRGPFRDFVFASEAMAQVMERARLAASLDVQVLLTGPTGTGKSLLAQCLHRASPRAAGPFVEVNCAAIPDTLLESELFGAAAGAHSAVANRDMPGKVTAAEGGTLFLDEVGDLSIGAQAKLLQFLQDGVYYRLGDPRPARADVRVVAATNRDLRAAVEAREFREDLYYRLQVLEVRIPPLAEREEDVLPLARHFLRLSSHRHDLGVLRLAPGLQRALLEADWPGNVRELSHRVLSGAVNSRLRQAARLSAEDVFPDADHAARREEDWREATRRFQRRHLLAVLDECDWNAVRTAKRLGLARTYLYSLMDTHGIERRPTKRTSARRG